MLKGKRALITGGASGLGAATARRFAEEGARVAIVDLGRAADRGERLALEIGGVFIPADVRDPASIDGAAQRAVDEFGGLELCVASAGVSGHPDAGFRGLLDLEPEHFDFVQDVNVRGVFLTVQATARRIIATGNGGSIVTLASMASKRASAGAYSVSKAAVWMLTRSFALELGAHSVRVNAIGPGYVQTEMLAGIAEGHAGRDPAAVENWYAARRAQTPMNAMPEPIDIANTAVFLCSDMARMFTGSILHPDAGLTTTVAGG